MDRDGVAVQTESPESTPSFGENPSNIDATIWKESEHLYIDQLNHLHRSTRSDTNSALSSPSDLRLLPSIETSSLTLELQYSPAFQDPKVFEIRANEAMSRQTSQEGSKSPAQYHLKSNESPADQARSMSQNNKDQLINSLRTHKVNTITELRRIEKIFAYLDSEEVTEPMTTAWAYYVNSNNLLNELRGLTKRIPFSSECVDEAKALVVADPSSARSWNYCWLVLTKVEKENLILKYAKALAAKRSTWGDKQPTGDDVRKFIMACVVEWSQALRQMLKHWEDAPSTTGS